MKYVQKLVLVPVERWEKIGDNILVKEVLVKSVSQMNVSQHPHQKKKKTHTSQMKRVKNQEGLGTGVFQKETLMFHFLIPEKRVKALKLFKYLLNNKIFALNEDGEIIQKGKTIHGSNIVELITYAVQNVSSIPVGMKYFYTTLKKKNIPEKYISNKKGRKIMNKSFTDESSSWRPPGRLNKKNILQK